MKRFFLNAGAGLLACLVIEGFKALRNFQFDLVEHGYLLMGWMLLVLLLIPVIDNAPKIVFYFVKKWEGIEKAAKGEDPDSSLSDEVQENDPSD